MAPKSAKAAPKSAAAPAAAPAVAAHRVRCVASRLGYYGLRRIRPGQHVVITLQDGQSLPSWVEPITTASRTAPAPPDEAADASPPDSDQASAPGDLGPDATNGRAADASVI